MNLQNYRTVILRENSEWETVCAIILLNEKHSIEDMQQMIYKAKEELQNNGNKEWQIEDVLCHDLLKEYDFTVLSYDGDFEI